MYIPTKTLQKLFNPLHTCIAKELFFEFRKMAFLKIALGAGFVVGVPVVTKELFTRFNLTVQGYDLPGDLKNHVIIVTGADSGIGKSTVEALADKGARVLMACRSMEKCNKVRREIVLNSKNRNVVCRECDLSSFNSIKKFVARVYEQEARLDVLINNAGVKYLKPKKTTRERIEMQMGTNYFGHFLLTLLLLEKLKASAPSRIVNVTGKAYTKGEINFDDLNLDTKYNAAKAYDQSKLALVLFTKELAKHLDDTKVTVNAVDPGSTNTEIDRHTHGTYSGWARNAFYYLFRRKCNQGAYPPLFAAFSFDLVGVSGKLVGKDLNIEEFAENAKDEKVQRKLWLTSLKWVRMETALDDLNKCITDLRNEMKEKETAESSMEKLTPAEQGSDSNGQTVAT